MSKKLNLKDKLNNFMGLPRELVSSSWDKFTEFMRSVSNHHMNDESLKSTYTENRITKERLCYS